MPIVFGFDTETHEGPPITVQIFSGMFPKMNALLYVNEKNVLDKTLRHFSKLPAGDYVGYGHNLKFDFVSLFWPHYEDLVQRRGVFDFTAGAWKISGIYGNTTFCEITSANVRIQIVDGFSWFKTALAKAADLVCPDLPKLTHPEDLGKKFFRPGDDEFEAYAMRDAEISYHIGMAIDAMHQEFELRQAVSVANMSAKIFQQHHIADNAPIQNIGHRMITGAVAAYHGGKNNIYKEGDLNAAGAWHLNVDAWDISSAYPHAMTLLPAFSDAKLFAAARVFRKNVRQVPDHGVYCISGKQEFCPWPSLYGRNLQEPLRGVFSDVWVTGYELNEALRTDEVTLTRCMGHVYDSDRDPVTETALQRFVKEFYELKQNATDPVRRTLYKVLLNSIYGKFIQTNEVENAEGATYWKPGVLYHPFMASLITGHTRAVMHRLEHTVKALHTATDGVFCGEANSPADGKFDFAPADGIGSITSEGAGCDLALVRNKCYILYSKTPAKGSIPSTIIPDRHILKFAKHGFQGSLAQVEEAVVRHVRSYEIEKPNTLRESIRRDLVPNKFEKRRLVLKAPPLKAAFNHQKRK